jgi:hypothetical protein
MFIFKKVFIVLALASSFATTSSASAVFQLNPTDVTAAPETDVSFSGVLTNTGGSDLFLNGDVSILPFAGLILDDSAFFSNAPLFLSPGGSYSGPFFDVLISDVTPGPYAGSFTIQGGDDGNSFDDLASQDFRISVPAVPEPRYEAALLAGLLVLFSRKFRSPWLCAPL